MAFEELGDGGGYADYQPPPRSNFMLVAVSVGVIVAGLVFLIATLNTKRDKPKAAAAGVRAPVRNVAPAIDDDVGDPFQAVKRELAFWWIIGVAWLLFCIFLAVWVTKDSRNRSCDSGPMWAIVVFLFGIIGLIVYLASRPNGTLIRCNHCGNRRLEYVTVCPHCQIRTGEGMRLSSGI